MALSLEDLRLIAALQEGLPLVPRPYLEIARRCGLTEERVLRRLGEWLEDGTLKRLGIVVRHHELGFRANAMVVWDIPDEAVDEVGRRLARRAEVTLCYRRPRRPRWPYNLFCMIHGRDRDRVEAAVARLCAEEGLDYPKAVLFSRRRFKQRGARYADPAVLQEAAHG